MAELRADPLTGIPVVLAPERADRPDEYVHRGLGERREVDCPFCPGREDRTPGETYALRDGSRWHVRVFPNKYPAQVPGGAHEVVVESPRHENSFASLSDAEAADVFAAYAARMEALGSGAYPLVFKNVGEAAGASIEHGHSQILATPDVPPLVRAELASSERLGACVLCAELGKETAEGVRVVLRTEKVVVYCPWGSRFPFEMRLAPRGHEPRFERSAVRAEAAAALREALRRLEAAAGRPSYNFAVHTAPAGAAPGFYHWHVELYPRTTGVGGFEWGTGMHINTLAPEAAARRLRDA